MQRLRFNELAGQWLGSGGGTEKVHGRRGVWGRGKGVRCAGVSTDRRNNSIVRLVEFLVLTFVFRFALFLFCLLFLFLFSFALSAIRRATLQMTH